MLKNSINRRVILVNLIIPFNLLIGLFLLFTHLMYMEKDEFGSDLKVKKFMHEPLLDLLENGQSNKLPPQWLLFVAIDSGEIIYFNEYNEQTPPLWLQTSEQQNIDLMLVDIIKKIPDTISMVPFKYKEQSGLAVYMPDLLPIHMKILQKPAYIGFVFFLTMLLFLMGLLQMNSYYSSIRKLVRASVRIANKDFDTEIILERRQRELRTVFLSFDQMRRALKSNREKETRFVMSVTHDLKTPLAAMRMYLEAMKDGYIEVSSEAKKAVTKILVKSGILEDRIGELLEYSKLQISTHKMTKEIIDVSQWIREENIFFEDECRMNNRLYTSEINLSDKLEMPLNTKLLNRALNNLIDNACRYTKKEDTIRFCAYSENNELILKIDDSGPGIIPSEREKIFELFYRADRGRNSRGMGIGLSSVQSIIENHGGSIICEESSMGGSSFSISVPINKG